LGQSSCSGGSAPLEGKGGHLESSLLFSLPSQTARNAEMKEKRNQGSPAL